MSLWDRIYQILTYKILILIILLDISYIYIYKENIRMEQD